MRFDNKNKIVIATVSILISSALTACSKQSEPDKDVEPVTRFLSFAAAADPQFSKNTKNPRVSFQNDIARFLLAKLYKDESYEGLIIAGDLTENTYKWEILKFYNTLLATNETELNPILERKEELNRLYEGIGNHDMRKGSCCAVDDAGINAAWAARTDRTAPIGSSFASGNSISPIASASAGAGAGASENTKAATHTNCICETGLTNIIDRGERQDQLRSQSPHYSWEWEGIRFVQLNLLPADAPETVWSGSDRDPQDALMFLKHELQDAGPDKNVIVVHHYGMDKFSRKWWSKETKEAYKEVIKDYRVVAIITGHLHWTRRSSNMQQCWNGVTAVTVGSIRLGLHVDFKIVDDHLSVARLSNGRERWSDSYSIGPDNTEFCGSNT